jgi:gluconate 2-dehydrogenase gamma chain
VSRINRRSFLVTAGGGLAGAWLATDVAKLLAAGEYAAAAGRQNPLPPFEYLKPDEAADLEAATAQIVPSDDTPGAKEARVVYFIDRALATWQREQRSVFRKGVAELRKRARQHGAKTFAALSDAQQQGVIAALDKENHEFFFALRGATIVGTFANPEYGGNFQKNGWKLLGFVDQFSWAPPFGWYDANAR